VVAQGRVNDDLVDFSDFRPTLLEAARVKIPEGLDGRSFLPQLRGDAGSPREWIYCYYCPRPERSTPVRFVRDQRWKLYGDGRLFDVENDPGEKYPLPDVDQRDTVAEVRRKLMTALQSLPAEGQSLLQFKSARGEG
jgi:arylsulfatase A